MAGHVLFESHLGGPSTCWCEIGLRRAMALEESARRAD